MRAADELDLTWQAIEGCPERAEVEQRIQEQLGRRFKEASTSLHVRARVRRSTRGYTLSLRTTYGDAQGRRKFRAPTCPEVSEAAVLVIALSLGAAETGQALPLGTPASRGTSTIALGDLRDGGTAPQPPPIATPPAPESAKPDPAKPQIAKAEPAKPEAAKPEPAKPEPKQAAPSAPPEPKQATPPPEPKPRPKPKKKAKPRPRIAREPVEPEHAARADAAPARPREPAQWSLRAGGLVEYGVMPRVDGGAELTVGLALGRSHIELTGLWLLPQRSAPVAELGARVEVALWAGRAAYCHDLVGDRTRLAGCAGIELGQVSGTGLDFPGGRKTRFLWNAGFVSVRLATRVHRRVGLTLEPAVAAAIARRRFVISSPDEAALDTLHAPKPTSIRVTVGVELYF